MAPSYTSIDSLNRGKICYNIFVEISSAESIIFAVVEPENGQPHKGR